MTETTRQDTPPLPGMSNPPPAASATMFLRRGAAWSEISALEASRFRLRLGGLFRTAWMAALCSGLAERHISIDQAHARLSHDGSWIVELSLLALPAAPDPMGVPYVELAEGLVPHLPTWVELERYELRPSTDHGAKFFLSIEARDSLGLLGSLLASLARLSLFPIEMHIETRGGRAYDSLWLATLDGEAGAQASHAGLDRLLQETLLG